MLLLYRLVVVQMERRRHRRTGKEYLNLSESSSRSRLMPNSNSTDIYYNYKTKINLREPKEDPDEPKVDYVIKRHLSNEKIPNDVGDHKLPADCLILQDEDLLNEDDSTKVNMGLGKFQLDLDLDLGLDELHDLTCFKANSSNSPGNSPKHRGSLYDNVDVEDVALWWHSASA